MLLRQVRSTQWISHVCLSHEASAGWWGSGVAPPDKGVNKDMGAGDQERMRESFLKEGMLEVQFKRSVSLSAKNK